MAKFEKTIETLKETLAAQERLLDKAEDEAKMEKFEKRITALNVAIRVLTKRREFLLAPKV